MEPMGFEPTPSAVQRRQDGLLEVSGTCNLQANCGISALTHFPTFQEIYPGCCTPLPVTESTPSVLGYTAAWPQALVRRFAASSLQAARAISVPNSSIACSFVTGAQLRSAAATKRHQPMSDPQREAPSRCL